jgi:hypothetical protein
MGGRGGFFQSAHREFVGGFHHGGW